MPEKDPDEILEQSKQQKRHTSEPTDADADETPSLEEEIVAVYEALDSDEVPSNLTMRDENLAALIRGLDAADQLDAVGADARDHLGRDAVDGETRGSVLRLLVRVGLTEARPDLLETGKNAHKQYLEQQSDEF